MLGAAPDDQAQQVGLVDVVSEHVADVDQSAISYEEPRGARHPPGDPGRTDQTGGRGRRRSGPRRTLPWPGSPHVGVTAITVG